MFLARTTEHEAKFTGLIGRGAGYLSGYLAPGIAGQFRETCVCCYAHSSLDSCFPRACTGAGAATALLCGIRTTAVAFQRQLQSWQQRKPVIERRPLP